VGFKPRYCIQFGLFRFLTFISCLGLASTCCK